ncbi:hypothetical protein P7K49_035300 [Saguinus oedipus]|uniref:Uncharacterized protein n=1 Tax=Saguinus oedipus TaxID=9490 RepID=A0ABQ9TMU8_SAGOE|nr:hypothetical protein P7K49_035300 [Saguinus oedipus]
MAGEETITTVVKSPHGRRRSPSKSPSRSPSHCSASPLKPGVLAPDLLYLPGAGQPRRPEAEPGRKPVVPTLYVTEAEALSPAPRGLSGSQPQWVEVEETIEVQVKKTGLQAASPTREMPRSSSGHLFTPPGATPRGDPNSNNSNNKLLAQEARGTATAGTREPLAFRVDAGGSVDCAASGTGSLEPEEAGITPEEGRAMEERGEEEGEDADTFVTEERRDPKILTHNGRVLTLADLEDYVPGEGETFRRGSPGPSTPDDPPCEVSVIQREIREPTVGRPVLLSVGRAPGPRGPLGFFRPQVRGPERASFLLRAAPAGPVGSAPRPRSFCTCIQRSAGRGPSSFTTELSTQTVNFGTVGETVTLHICPDGDGDEVARP